MRKGSILGVASLIFGATLVTAAPAQAWVPNCKLGPVPATSTVTIENGEIRLNPGGPSSDVAAFRSWVTTYVNCWKNQVLNGPLLTCVTGLGVGGPYVYEDPYTGQYVIAYQALIDHAAALAACAG